MAWSTGGGQSNTPPDDKKPDLFFARVSGGSKDGGGRRPVRIRPPSPRICPRQSPARSQSCEPPTRSIIHPRAHSLPSPRPPSVRFLDSLGLDLESVKVFQSGEDPFVPEHVLFRLLMSAELSSSKMEISLPYLQPLFSAQPGDSSGFVGRLLRQRVCLERVLCYEPGIIGIVQVLNLAFEKDVSVRYSFTDWKSCSETKAHWVSSRSVPGGPSSDAFRFHLPVPPFILHPGAVLEFALCYKVQGAQFWDNNGGENYKLTCQSYNLPVPKECEDSMIHFI